MFNGEHVKAKPPDLNPRNIWDVFWLLCVVLRLVEKKNNGPMDAYCTVIALSQRRLTFDAGTVELDANFSRISTSFPHRRNYFLFPLFHSIDKLLGFPATWSIHRFFFLSFFFFPPLFFGLRAIGDKANKNGTRICIDRSPCKFEVTHCALRSQ